MIREIPKVVVEHVDSKVPTADEIHERLKEVDELIKSGDVKEAQKIIEELEPYIESGADISQDNNPDTEEIFRMMVEDAKNKNDV